MKWYCLFSNHIQEFNDYFKHLSSEKLVELNDYIDDYYQKHINNMGLTTPEPNFNPFKEMEFLLMKKPDDLYIWLSKISRHLIVSQRLHEIFNSFEIYGSRTFGGVHFKNKAESQNDYIAYLFYKNMWDNLDFNESKFVFKDFYTRETLHEFEISNNEEYIKLINENGRISGKIVGFKKLIFRVDKYFDLFFLFNIDEIHPFVSEELYLKLEKSRLRGVELSEMNAFSIELKLIN